MFPNKNISIDRKTYERLRSFQQARRALSMRFESLSACISSEGRPSDIGDVYAFADSKGICESTAHAFYELNEKKGWNGMQNWKGALIAFSKVDKP